MHFCALFSYIGLIDVEVEFYRIVAFLLAVALVEAVQAVSGFLELFGKQLVRFLGIASVDQIALRFEVEHYAAVFTVGRHLGDADLRDLAAVFCYFSSFSK